MNERYKEAWCSIISAAQDLGLEVISYSGRGMYGKKCLGVTGDFEPYRLGVLVGKKLEPGDASPPTSKQDSMGRGIVLYWPELGPPREE